MFAGEKMNEREEELDNSYEMGLRIFKRVNSTWYWDSNNTVKEENYNNSRISTAEPLLGTFDNKTLDNKTSWRRQMTFQSHK